LDDQLREIDHGEEEAKEGIDNFKDEDKKRVDKQIKRQAQLDFIVEGSKMMIDYANVDRVTINYYQIDLEIMFSKSPFMSSKSDDFSFVQPYFTEEKELPKGGKESVSFDIPAQLAKHNLVIEVSYPAKGLKKSQTYSSANLRARLIENLGQVKIFNAKQQPLPKTYVKVYKRGNAGGEGTFYKDGYTDIRGRFDYASLSGADTGPVDRFAIFVHHEEEGCLVKEAVPPTGMKIN